MRYLISIKSKCHQHEEYQQTVTKLSSSEGSQDTSAYKISGHYRHAFYRKTGNHKFELLY